MNETHLLAKGGRHTHANSLRELDRQSLSRGSEAEALLQILEREVVMGHGWGGSG